MKSFSSNLILLTLTACLAVSAVVPTLAAQNIRMRGLDIDLGNTADTMISLDLNGDGKADILYYRPGGGDAYAYLSHGDGTFRKVSYVSGGQPMNGFPGDLSSANDRFVALDFNGDGKSDFIEYRPGSGYSFLCLSNGDGTVNCSTLSDPQHGPYNGFGENMQNTNTRLVAADLNHDGRSDIVAYTPGGGEASFYLSLPNGTFQHVQLTTGYNAQTTSTGFDEDMRNTDVQVVALDMNGDGYADLMVYTPKYGEVRLYRNNGNNTFHDFPLSYGGANGYGFHGNAFDTNAHLIALDLDGNGRSDFLWWQAGSHVVTGYLSNGDGTFKAVDYLPSGGTPTGFVDTDSSTADTAVALDLNGDGKSDFLWYSPGGGILTAYVSGAGGTLTSYPYQDGQGNHLGFNSAPSSTADVILPLNFLGQAASGFVNYTPGGGNMWLNAPPVGVGPSSVNSYATRMYPQTLLRDLGWSVGNIPLKEIVMPGTHDAAMYDLNNTNFLGFTGLYNTTQVSDFIYQLGQGARALDFRDTYYTVSNGVITDVDGATASAVTDSAPTSSGFYLYGHSIGAGATNRTSLDAFNTIENWLIDNPDEVVILLMTNQAVYQNHSDDYVTMLKQTVHPELIYTQMVACGSTFCPQAAVQPQNMTIAQLKKLGTRLILINGSITSTGYQWANDSARVGYCGVDNGESTPEAEYDCLSGTEGSPSVEQTRPSYEAADAAPQFFEISAVLTPAGGFRPSQVVPTVLPPLLLAELQPNGYNDGTNPDDFNQLLATGAWRLNAFNLITLDAIENDGLVPLILQRNDQTWTNMNFVAVSAESPAVALSVGVNGDAWAAGGGHAIDLFKYNPATGVWVKKINNQQNIKKLAVDAAGGVWVVDASYGTGVPYGRLIHYDANGQNGAVANVVVQDVAVGKNGSVWVVLENGYIFELSGPTDGSADIGNSIPLQQAQHIAVDNVGHPWVIDFNFNIQKFNGTGWQQVSGAQGKEIVAGADGSIFVTGSEAPSIGRYNTQSNDFTFFHMDAAHIAVDGGGHPWAIRFGTGTIYKGALDQM